MKLYRVQCFTEQRFSNCEWIMNVLTLASVGGAVEFSENNRLSVRGGAVKRSETKDS